MNWFRSKKTSTGRVNRTTHTNVTSSSSEIVALESTEDDFMIAQVLSAEELYNAAAGHPLSHLSSIPHIPRVNRSIPASPDAESDHHRLLERLYEYGLEEQKMSGDGNCQFRAISDQLYRTPEKHKSVRKQVVYQLKAWKDLYQEYVPMNYHDYVRKMGKQGEWGDHVTLQAAADSFGMKICLVTSFKDTRYIEILPKSQQQRNDIFLSFWSEVHYNSLYQITDPATTVQKIPQPRKKHWLF